MSASEATAGFPPGESRYLEGQGGTRIHYRAWPVDEPRAAVFVLHGLFEYSHRYLELAAVMNDAGFATFAMDHRGHGQSEGRRGHVARFGRFVDDAHRFHQAVVREVPAGTPRFLLGHSMGGLISIRLLEEYQPELAGAVITSPWLGVAQSLPAWQRTLGGVLNRLAPIAPFPSGVDAGDLSHDPERVADYRDDPAIFSSLTIRLGLEAQEAMERAFSRRDRIAPDLPLLFLVAGADSVVDASRSLELARSLPGDDVTVRVLEGYYHEVLQEVERAAVMAEIQSWIEVHVR
jgi:alpha-beta hydrolase superfamily lysophospholipase